MVNINLNLDTRACNAVAEDVLRYLKNNDTYMVMIDAKTSNTKRVTWTIVAFEVMDSGTMTGSCMLYTVWLELDKPNEFHVNFVEGR